jgi:hypothetical protein
MAISSGRAWPPAIKDRAHHRASSASCLGLAQDSHWITGLLGGVSTIGMPRSRTQEGTRRGPATQRTSITLERASSSGRQTGDIPVRPFTEIRPNNAFAW